MTLGHTPSPKVIAEGTSTDPVPSGGIAASAAGKTSRHGPYFQTDHLMADLRGRSVRGGAVTLAAQGIQFVLQTGSTMVLARLLTPADFGLVAMVTAVTGFVGLFKDAGLSMATVQREHITHEQVSTLFWINVGLSVVLMALTAALAPVLAWFYGEPRLSLITLALAGIFVVSGLTVQHQALLQRQMRFKDLAIIQVASMAAGIVAAVGVAAWTRSYWALVAMPAASAAANATAVWVACRWAPGPPRRGAGVMPMLRFGGNLTGFNTVNYFARNADNILIGWWWGAGPLGVYSKAYSLLMLPLRQINAPILAAVMPALSRLNEDPVRYRRAYMKMLQAVCLTSMSLIAVLIASSDVLIYFILGRDWMAAAPVFAWLGLAGLVQPANNALGSLLISQGRGRDQLWSGVASAITTVAAFAVLLPYGITVMAAGYALLVLLRAPLLWWWAGRLGPVSGRDIAVVLRFPLALSGVAIAPSIVSGWVMGGGWSQDVAGILGCLIVISVALCCTRSGRDAAAEVLSIGWSIFAERRKQRAGESGLIAGRC